MSIQLKQYIYWERRRALAILILPIVVRDAKRATFKNLRFLIIDEVSMVKADQLYQLDLRLREITMRPNKLFGGVALFFLRGYNAAQASDG
jgi:hypothetical protein